MQLNGIAATLQQLLQHPSNGMKSNAIAEIEVEGIDNIMLKS
jgi:hypothetical protein